MATMVSPATVAAEVKGRFGAYGGRYVPETLMAALLELEQAYMAAREDAAFQAELDDLLKHYVGRPTPRRMTTLRSMPSSTACSIIIVAVRPRSISRSV